MSTSRLLAPHTLTTAELAWRIRQARAATALLTAAVLTDRLLHHPKEHEERVKKAAGIAEFKVVLRDGLWNQSTTSRPPAEPQPAPARPPSAGGRERQNLLDLRLLGRIGTTSLRPAG
ncbi:hypothetical protein [Streptomyces sp. NPDC048357]|uniref:hypothetical protein n=1 Tax=Streptomyces sp. NPDC048357 TaxID=3154719 RepID=UPI00341A4C9B